MVATWPDFVSKRFENVSERVLFLVSFPGGYSSEKTYTTNCCFTLGSYHCTGDQSPVAKGEETFLLQIIMITIIII